MAKLLIISALQRSGTTALSHVLGAAPGVTRKGEIFHAARKKTDDPNYGRLHLDPTANFFTFRDKLIGKRKALLYPSARNQAYILDAFLDHLLDQKSDWTLVDIKYNGWHHFESIYATPGEPPALLDMLRDRGAAIIHVKRKNLLARWLSDQVAQARGQYHYDPGETPPDTRITVDPQQAIAAMEQTLHLFHRFNQWFTGFSPTLNLEYEKMFVDAALTQDTADYLGGMLGIEIAPDALRPPMDRALGDPAAAVANWDELRAALVATHFAPMAQALDGSDQTALAA
jgi:hypothetical protein